MSIKRFLLVGLLSVLGLSATAQKKQVLFTIDDKPYYTDDFVRVYNKNLDLVKDDSQKDIDNYLDLYLAYKMKVNKAYDLGLDKNPKYIKELESYRSQLSKNYLTDTNVSEQLIREAYDRSLKEIKAAHILVLVDENATPQDTLKAYQKIKSIRERILKGEDFGKLAQELSEDPSAKENKGDLGYFSVFRMVYPFENGAYTTKKGEVSEPVKTRFGYHLIKVNDIRDNRGEISVAHIMLSKPENPEKKNEVQDKINTIYQKLQQGEKFEDLANQFSEDKSSAPKGGKLARIASGQLNSITFENAAFAIKNAGDYTKPIETEFGWHIIKLLEKHPLKTFEESKADLENKIKRDERSRRIAESMNRRLEKKYNPKVNKELFKKGTDLISDEYYEVPIELPESTDEFNKVILTIENKNISGIEFLNFIKSQQNILQRVKPLAKLKETIIENFINENLLSYYDENLENEFVEFKHIMDEYKEGLLLFDLMEKEIWQKAQTDTLGLEKFYNANKNNYKWNQRLDAIIASSVNRDFVEQTQKFLKEEKSVDFIKKELNKDAKINIMIDQGYFEQGSSSLPKNYTLSKGISDIYKDGDYYYVIEGKEIVPSSLKTLEEARGRVVSDYQQYLEEHWIDSLKKEFSYKVNEKVLKKVKKQLKK
ncbi:MAG: peptidylprolyl isomerase [Flavobacteriaceae bacterium]